MALGSMFDGGGFGGGGMDGGGGGGGGDFAADVGVPPHPTLHLTVRCRCDPTHEPTPCTLFSKNCALYIVPYTLHRGAAAAAWTAAAAAISLPTPVCPCTLHPQPSTPNPQP